MNLSELQPRLPEPDGDDGPAQVVLPTLELTFVGASAAGCSIVVVGAIAWFVFATVAYFTCCLPDGAAPLGPLAVALLVGRLAIGEWGWGGLRAAGVVLLAACAGGGTLLFPIEDALVPRDIAAAGAVLVTGTLAGGVLLRRRPSEQDVQRSV